MMQVVEITSFGAPEVLRLGERARPQVGAGEMLIRVGASGVNRPDVLQRTGNYPVPPGASDIAGLEVAGVVQEGEASALAAAGFKVGDRVCALLSGGGYAQYAAAPIAQCLPVPAGLSDVQAAALPETFFTVWSNVFDRGALKSGETLLVQGGASGIGVAAIQMGKAFGARVIVTAGTDEKCQACIDLGAEAAINYRKSDFVSEVKALIGGQQAGTSHTVQGKAGFMEAGPKGGVDVILDMVAGSYVARELECLAEDGRLVIIAVQGGLRAEINTGLLLRRRLHITGSTLRPRSVAFKAAIARNLRQHVWPRLDSGLIKPVVYRTFPASQAAQAHALMESNVHVGKIVLTWS